jgi:UDP-N-acetylmuramoyl-L-alanyl-D-glutamate--2,6-diaminopimelate ligase
MRLSSLLQNIIPIPSEIDTDVLRMTLDSRQAQPGDVFIALKGTKVDGREFIADVIARGAAAVLVEADGAASIYKEQITAIIPIVSLRNRLGEIAASFYGFPARNMKMFGVTGTNGKTSCTHFLAQALQYFNLPCGVLGTLGNGIYGALGEPGLTTPDPITLHATLKEFLQQGAKATAMEVSSHSIDQGRVNGIAFEAGMFTNLTQDHLDYHGTMSAYAAVKKRFFEEFAMKHAVINADDAYGKAWLQELAAKRSVFAYGLERADLPSSIPQIYTEHTTLSLSGIHTQVVTPWGRGELSLPLIGQFNLSNVLAVLAVLCLQEIPFENVLKVLSQLTAVPGRMQLLGGHGRPLVAVDYSHTPDALEKALLALKRHTQGKLVCVFGCGGNRDAAKRPLMARIAEQHADRVIVTNDNPRHEDPQIIAQQIMGGFQHPERISVVLDRSKAIEKSIQYATANDCILVAGKGAEHYQQIGDQKYPFDDVSEVSRYLNLSVEEPHGDS